MGGLEVVEVNCGGSAGGKRCHGVWGELGGRVAAVAFGFCLRADPRPLVRIAFVGSGILRRGGKEEAMGGGGILGRRKNRG